MRTEAQKAKIRELIATIQVNKLLRGFYMNKVNGENCYCALGHALNICGIPNSRLIRLGTIAIATQYKNSRRYGVITELASTLIAEFGLSAGEAEKLQDMNDEYTLGSGWEEPLAKARVIDYLESLL